jgi:gliding motility-associated protein GldC
MPIGQRQKMTDQMEKIEKTSQLRVAVGLDKDNLPVDLQWDADDRAPGSQPVPCKAMLLSLFERETLDTIKIDLWTVDMQVNEMDRFFFQTLRSMADTYYKATQNRELAVDMQRFVQYFGEKTGLIRGDGA